MKLKTVLITIFTSVCIVATGTVALIADNSIAKQTAGKIQAELEAKRNYLAGDINGWVLEKARVVESLSVLYGDGIGPEITPEYLNPILGTAGMVGAVSDVYIGTEQGVMIDGSLWVPGADYDPRERPWYQAAEVTDNVIFTDAYQDMVTGKWAISVAKSIKSSTGTLEGVIAMDILLDTITEKIAEQKLGDTGYSMLLDNKGIFIAHPNAELLNTNILDIAELTDLANAMLSQESGYMEYTYQGVNKIMVFQKLPSTSWIVAITIDQSEAYAELVKSRISFVILIILVIFLAVAFGFIATEKITKPIKSLTKEAKKAADGDLRIVVPHSNTEEIHALAEAFSMMTKNIGNLVLNIDKTAYRVNNSSEQISSMTDNAKNIAEEISKTAHELAIGAGTQAEAVTGGAEKVTSITKVISKVTQSSQESHQMILAVDKSVINGMNALDKQQQLMQANDVSTGKVQHAIMLLEEKASEIQKIVNVIGEIADQTNLLSLNAAIEAARAGEQGKGFAVVADEVRKLAEQSASSSSDIEALLKDILDKTMQSVMDVAEVQQIVQEQKESMGETRQLYGEIQSAVKIIVEKTISISTETMDLLKKAEQVSSAMSDVAAITEESAAATEEVASATSEQSSAFGHVSDEVEELVKDARALLNAISTFKV